MKYPPQVAHANPDPWEKIFLVNGRPHFGHEFKEAIGLQNFLQYTSLKYRLRIQRDNVDNLVKQLL